MIKKNKKIKFWHIASLSICLLSNMIGVAQAEEDFGPTSGPSTPAANQQLNDMMKAMNDPKMQALMRGASKQASQDMQETAPLSVAQSKQKENELANMRTQYNESMALQERSPEIQNNEAFNALLHEALPLSPDQIKTLRKLYDLSAQAVSTPPKAPPTPTSSSTVISLEPGSTPPIIRLAAGFVSSLVFVDSTGAPWPLTAYSIGDPNSFNVQWDQKTNTLFVQAIKAYCHGNIAVRLHGLNTPVMISLVSGQREVDFRVDLQVAGRGPQALPPVMSGSYQDAKINPFLINLLDGVPPKGSIKLNVSGGQGEAWMLQNSLYFRTKLTVLSPAWVATVRSPDGTNVYEMAKTPLILASKDGKAINIYLTGL